MTRPQMKQIAQLVSDLMYWNACESCGATGRHCTRVVIIGAEPDDEQNRCGVTNRPIRWRKEITAKQMDYDGDAGTWLPNLKYRIANGLADDDECGSCGHPRYEHDDVGCVALGSGEGDCDCKAFAEAQ